MALLKSGLAAALLLGVASGCDVPGLTSDDVAGLQPVTRGWLSGLITDARDGTGLSDATVLVAEHSAVSGAGGEFRVELGIFGREQTVELARSGYQPRSDRISLQAGENTATFTLFRLGCGVCGVEEVCDPSAGGCVREALLSGGVKSACTGEGLDARVTVDGRSTCSTLGKAYFRLSGLRPGGPYSLSVGKVGYQAYSTSLTLAPGANVLEEVALTPVGGCAAIPAPAACTCTTPNCVP